MVGLGGRLHQQADPTQTHDASRLGRLPLGEIAQLAPRFPLVASEGLPGAVAIQILLPLQPALSALPADSRGLVTQQHNKIEQNAVAEELGTADVLGLHLPLVAEVARQPHDLELAVPTPRVRVEPSGFFLILFILIYFVDALRVPI